MTLDRRTFNALFPGLLGSGPLAALAWDRLEAQPTVTRLRAPPDPVAWAERVSGLTLDPWQRKVLLSSATYFLFNCSRQVGKTEIVSLKAAYRARFLGRKVVAIAPSLHQSSKIRQRAHRYLLADGASFSVANAITLELTTGGSVVSLPGDRPDLSARSETTDDLIVDEASRVKDALITAVTPTTATRPDATVTYLSTPAGKRGAFYRAWQDPKGKWEKYSIKATECSRISREFLEQQKNDLGVLYQQEFECAFIADSAAVLDPALVEKIFRNPGLPEAGQPDWAAPVAEASDYWADTSPAQSERDLLTSRVRELLRKAA